MATLTIGGGTYSPAISPRETFSVWVKREWGDAWIRVPYLIPLSFSEAAFPTIAQARLRWEYGTYVNKWYHSGGALLPAQLENWILKIVVHSAYENYIGFIGVVIGETMVEEGVNSTTGFPTGYQEIECHDISVLLKRRRVIGTFVGDGVDWTYLKRTRPLNRGLSHREGAVNNRSTNYHSGAGCYMFEEDGAAWSNAHIIEYLLACFQPWFPIGSTVGGAVELTPLWRVTGQIDALYNLFGEFNFWGKDVFTCLDQLIDRRRGFGAHIITDGEGPIYLNIYSLSEYQLNGLGGTFPANPRQGWVPTGGDHHVQANYQITEMRAVDRITVESDEPIKVMSSWHFGDGSLEAGWADDTETEYEAATDDQRRSDYYDAVYQRFRVPKGFDFSPWIPSVDDLGNVDINGVGAWWHHDMGVERYLPIEEAGTDGTEIQYVEPFLVIAKADRTRDLAVQLGEAAGYPYSLASAQSNTNPQITEAEFDEISADDTNITLADINTVIAAATYEYFTHDKAMSLEYPAISFQPGDRGLSFFVRSEVNHTFGHNRFTGDSEKDTRFDYKELIATMFFRTDEVLRVALPVWTGTYVDANGQTAVVANPQGREIHIVVPGQECWVVAPNTVRSVEDQALVLHNSGAAEIIRNDVAKLWWTALVAYAWYGTPRAVVRLRIQNHMRWFPMGYLIKATLNGFWWQRVGTCVTHIEHDCESRMQVVTTSFGEMDPQVAVEDTRRGR